MVEASSTPSSTSSPSRSSSTRPSRGIKRRLPGHPKPLVEKASAKNAKGIKTSGSFRARERQEASSEQKTSSIVLEETSEPSTEQPKRENEKIYKEQPKREKEEICKEQRLLDGWKDEYFEIIEQLPLELHRSFALLRELEMQMRTHAVTIRDESIFYRDWRTQRAAKLQEKWQLAENRSIQEQTHQEKFMPLIQPQKSSPNPNDYVHLHAPRLPPCQFRLCRQIFRNAEGAPRNEIIEESEVGAVVGGEPQGAPSGRTNHVATAAALSGPQRAPYRKDKASVEPRKTTYIRHASLSRISRAINNSMAAAEEKVGLALAVYQLIDRQCRRLDTDLAKMTGTVAVAVAAAMSEDAALLSPAAAGVAKESAGSPSQQGQSQGNQECLDSMGEAGLYGASLHLGARERARSRRHGGMGGTGKVFIAKEAEDAASKKQGKRTRRFAGPDVAGAGAQEGLQENGAAGTVDSGGILADMAYDPSEPVYCYCRQPSFGFMVGCDNDECAREWYHLSCLESRGELTPSVMQSLEDERKKWFCKDCHAASKGAGDDEGRKTLTRKRSKKRSH